MYSCYTHPAYAASLAEFGAPCQLPGSGGWVLERPIPGYPEVDATGCYPIFSCVDWKRLGEDLQAAGDRWVSLAAVPDPFGEITPEDLRACFPDVFLPFKEHYAVDLSRQAGLTITSHHRYYARQALKALEITVISDLPGFLPTWQVLYAHLVQRRRISGIRAFSAEAFARLFEVPGVTILCASLAGQPVAAHIWLAQGESIYSHLAAASEEGYRRGAFYALYACAIDHFKTQAAWLDLGGAAGLVNSNQDGLSRFKRGWANHTRMAYLGGRIFQPARYEQIVREKAARAGGYFPAYRQGEFA